MSLLAALIVSLQLPTPPYVAHKLADGVYAVPGDTGRGSEGRPNAGFIVTPEGVVVVDALASPRQGEALLATIRRVTRAADPLAHPDAPSPGPPFRRHRLPPGRRQGDRPSRHAGAGERGGRDALVADWVRVVGLDAMRGFEFADAPDRPVTGTDTLRLGGRTILIIAAGGGHSPGDLLVWLPREKVLFAGDLLIEDGVTMVVDGSAPALVRGLARIDSLAPRVAVPGHGAIPRDAAALVARTRAYITGLARDMRAAVEHGVSMKRALDALPPPDENRPVSLNSRRRRNAARVYVEEERSYMGLEASP